MLQFYVNDNDQDWDTYASIFAYAYQEHRSTNTRPFDLVSNWRIPDFTIEFTGSTIEMLTAAEQQAGFLSTLQHSLDRSCVSLQLPHDCYKRDLDRRLCKVREMVKIVDYVFIDVLDGATKTLELGYAVKEPYRVLGQD